MIQPLPSLDSLLQSSSAMFQDARNAAGQVLAIDPKTGKPIPDPYSTQPPLTTTVNKDSSTGVVDKTKQVVKDVLGQTGVDAAAGANSFWKWAAGVVDRNEPPHNGVTLEDMALIVLGLIMLAAAGIGLMFTFDATKKAAKTITKTARGSLDAKMAAALVP
jgi:hypothetical protein